jgi:hypothetical protein
MPRALEPDEAWSDGEHTVRLWIARQPGAQSTVTYGRADKPEFVDQYKHEGDARHRYEELVMRYEAAGKGNP